jgi:dolichyl-diphosphooligosaccharide--protein glycosyltransferase
LIYALLTGIALGMYLLSWAGGPLFVFILFSSTVFLYIIDHLRGKSTDYLCIIGVPIFLTALVLIIPFLDQLAFRDLLLMSLVVSTLSFPVLTGISKLMESRNIRRAYYPLALVGIGLISLGVFHIIDPSLLDSMLGKFNIFKPTISALTISEVQPLFSVHDGSPLAPAWNRFTTSVIIAPISLILVTYDVIKKISAEKTLFLIWTAIMLAAMVGQVRFTYYFAVNAALLSGYFCWRIPGWISGTSARLGFRELPPQLERGKIEDSSKRKKAKSRKGRELRARERRGQPNIITRYLKPSYVSGALAVIVVFFLAFYPNIGPAIDKASATRGSNDDWHSALLWMRDNTPDPFQDPDFYYEAYERPPAGEGYDYPQSAYGVMSWWDYGHWITAIAHRIPNSNPHQAGAVAAAEFFTAQRESTANEILSELGSRYVIIDFYMATPYEIIDGEIATSKFSAITTWAGKSESDFFDVYYWRTGEVLEPIPLLYPEYYQSMSSRLYNFDGKQVVPGNSTLVISYIERNGYKVLSTAQPFPTYEEAKAYLERQTSPNYRIVGNDPFASPVPLEELEHYQLIHQSEPWRAELGGKIIAPPVKIFEYVP